jgi:membrane protease YdiL (CAAX protease family)
MSEATSEGNPGSFAPGTEQHTVALSAALHLLPGILIAAFYVLVGVPIAESLGYPSLFGLLLSVVFVLVPSELGWLLYLWSRRNGSPSLEGVVLYRERIPVRRLALLGLALLVWAVLVSVSLSWLDALLFEAFFPWVPERFVIEQGLGSYLTGYPRFALIFTLLLGLVLSGIVAPVVEEMYFRGYLLPRLSRLGRWAPVLNVTLFALYHLWTPWQAATRIISILPAAYVVQRTKNIYVYMWVHCTLNTVGILLTLAAVLAGIRP